jgi:hypothetical protein
MINVSCGLRSALWFIPTDGIISMQQRDVSLCILQPPSASDVPLYLNGTSSPTARKNSRPLISAPVPAVAQRGPKMLGWEGRLIFYSGSESRRSRSHSERKIWVDQTLTCDHRFFALMIAALSYSVGFWWDEL